MDLQYYYRNLKSFQLWTSPVQVPSVFTLNDTTRNEVWRWTGSMNEFCHVVNHRATKIQSQNRIPSTWVLQSLRCPDIQQLVTGFVTSPFSASFLKCRWIIWSTFITSPAWFILSKWTQSSSMVFGTTGALLIAKEYSMFSRSIMKLASDVEGSSTVFSTTATDVWRWVTGADFLFAIFALGCRFSSTLFEDGRLFRDSDY